MKTTRVFQVVVHYSDYLDDRMISFNATKKYNFISDDDLMARELAVKDLKDEWEHFNEATRQSHLIQVLYCETTLCCFLQGGVAE